MPKCPFGKDKRVPEGCRSCLSFSLEHGCLKTYDSMKKEGRPQ